MQEIRNFTIIAHIDHGKSTLADRMLEITETVAKRKLVAQTLDQMDLERERGITIKMQPVRMQYKGAMLHLIDTPGHIDFSYEVSRALKAVEGAVLLVDATQGVQAQTLSVLSMARAEGLAIIPVVNKVDSPLARVDEVTDQIARLMDIPPQSVLEVSGKTGQGVEALLDKIVSTVPPPQKHGISGNFRSLVFDSNYSDHRGVIVYVRVFDGSIRRGDSVVFKVAQKKFSVLEVGTFSPRDVPLDSLSSGEVGYIVTGIKEPGVARVGDTVASEKDTRDPLRGYQEPKPVVWASVYPESQDDFLELKHSLSRLKLSDSSLSFEEETSGVLGRGFRIGFLGMLHLEIVTERLKREFDLSLVVTTPSITYRILLKNGKEEVVYTPSRFPDDSEIEKIFEPWVSLTIITPSKYLGSLLPLLYEHEAVVGHSETVGEDRTSLSAKIPLRELMRHLFDEIKSVSSGYASISYEIIDEEEALVTRLDVCVAEEIVPAFSRVVARRRLQEEAEQVVERLEKLLPRQLFVTKIQAKGAGRILSSRSISALKKDVTGYLYGGDITRKMKLREKQKRGKKRMQSRGKVHIPHDVFMKMMRGRDTGSS